MIVCVVLLARYYYNKCYNTTEDTMHVQAYIYIASNGMQDINNDIITSLLINSSIVHTTSPFLRQSVRRNYRSARTRACLNRGSAFCL